MAKIYDQLFKAQLENSASDLSPAATGLIYFNTVSLFGKVYNGTVWKTLVETDSAQVLTNKDYDGGTASNTSRQTIPKASLATLQGLTRKEGTIVYASDTQTYLGDDGVNLSSLGGGSGQGEINTIENSSASTAITGWAASGAGITVARTTTGTDLPLSPLIDSAIKITPVSGTDYAYYRFTMPEGLKNKKLKWEWFQRPLAGYADGDIKVEIYKNSASNYGGSYTEFVLSTDVSGNSLVPNLTGKFTTYFDADDADYYEIRYVRVTGTTALNIANVIVGPGIQPQGAIVTGWTPHTLVTDGMGTIANDKCIRARSGSTLLMKGYLTVGTLSGAVVARIFLPTGLTIDHSQLTDTRSATFGKFKQLLASTTDLSGSTYDGVLTWATGDDTSLVLTTQSASNLFAGNVANTVLSAGVQVSFEIEVPIAEWVNGGTLNLAENAIEYASNSSATNSDDLTSFVYGPAGATGPLGVTDFTDRRQKYVKFNSPILPTDEFQIQISSDGLHWYPMIGYINSSADVYGIPVLRTQDTPSLANSSGIALEVVNDTTVSIFWGAKANKFTGFTTGWNSYTGFKWRVRKASAAAALGFADASDVATGLAGPSGTWTPTATPVTNVNTVTPGVCMYTRVGKIVTVSGHVTVRPTASGIFEANLSLPISSNFNSDPDVSGVIASADTSQVGGHMTQGNDNLTIGLEITFQAVATVVVKFSGQYIIK